MSLLPYVFDRRPFWPSLLTQDLGLAPEALCPALSSTDFYRPFQQLTQAAQELALGVKSDDDKFQVNVDVHHFTPEEISVKTADGEIIVEGKHEEKRDPHGYVSRQFVRRYALPEGCDIDNVQSQLSSDGVLTVNVPKRPNVKGERVVPIQHTGPAVKGSTAKPVEAK